MNMLTLYKYFLFILFLHQFVKCQLNNAEFQKYDDCKLRKSRVYCRIYGKVIGKEIVAIRNEVILRKIDQEVHSIIDKDEKKRIIFLYIETFNIFSIRTTGKTFKFAFNYPTIFYSFFNNFNKMELSISYRNLSNIHGYIEQSESGNTKERTMRKWQQSVYLKSILPPTDTLNKAELRNLIFEDKIPILNTFTYNGGNVNATLNSIQIYLQHLQSLDVSGLGFKVDGTPFFNNDLHHIQEFKRLKLLKLKNLSIKNIPDGVITSETKFKNLKIINLSHNSLKEIPKVLRYFVGLEEIIIIQQFVSNFYLNASFLENLRRLKILNVSFNNISNPISKTALPNITSLERLYLHDCSIKMITEDAFINLPNLWEIELSNNNIKVIQPNTFINLFRVDLVIHMSFNNLVDNLALNVNNVFELFLMYNNIQNISTIISKGKVRFLKLNENKITVWTQENVFQTEQYEIVSLSLAYNKINTITSTMSKSLSTLRAVVLDGNPFDCGLCSLKEFQNWLNKSNNIVHNFNNLKITDRNLYCKFPKDKQNKLVLDVKYIEKENCKVKNYYLIYGVPGGIILVILIIISLVVYEHRQKLLFLYHLKKIQKTNGFPISDDINFDFDVFVSYCVSDRDWVVHTLVPTLESPTSDGQKYTLCLHERDFPLGSFIMDNIINSIEQSRRVVLVLSESFIASKWCQWELQLAQHRIFEENRPNFLVLIELERLNRSILPLHLRAIMETRSLVTWPQDLNMHEDILLEFWTNLRLQLGNPMTVVRNDQEELQDEEESSIVAFLP